MSKPHVLQTAAVLAVAVLIVLFGLLAGCTPTPFRVGDVTQPPHGCAEAKGRGHDC